MCSLVCWGPRSAMVVVVAMTLGACDSGKLDGEEDLHDSGAAGGDIDITSESSPTDAPELLSATVYQSGSKCFLDATYDDPQGPADVRRGTVWAVSPSSGDVMWSDELFVCIDYECIGSYDDSHLAYASAPCNQIERFELHAVVYDRSGHESNEVVLDLL
mgnify:CR=1 FL=1